MENVSLSDSQASIPPFALARNFRPAAARIWIDLNGLEKSTAGQKIWNYIMVRLEQGLNAPTKKDVDSMIDTSSFKDWDKLCLSGGVLHFKFTLKGQEFLKLAFLPGYEDIVFKASMMTLDTRAEVVQHH